MSDDPKPSRIPGWLAFLVLVPVAGFAGMQFGFLGIAVFGILAFVYYAYQGYAGEAEE